MDINAIIARWTGPARPRFATGKLWDEGTQCCCAQGDILLQCGILPQKFPDQWVVDRQIAEWLGISLFHSILLRVVNDSPQGCPERVLQFTDDGLGLVLGPNWRVAVAFGEHLGGLSAAARAAAGDAAWAAVGAAAGDAAWAAAVTAARAAARAAAGVAAGAAAVAAARAAVGDVVGDVVGAAAGAAAQECVGISHLTAPAFFLPLFGITDVAEFVRVANLRWRD